jgi:hypothetical protein
MEVGGGEKEVAQTIYTHVSKCKNDKIKGERKKRRRIWLMYFLYENEYRIFKPVEITIRRGRR